jgi:glycosyltransferase involved in cell wall biosynthesis
MKILHVYKTYYPDPPGGLQEAIRQICLSTKSYNIESRILTLSPSPNPKIIKFKEADVWRAKSWLAPVSCDLGGLGSLIMYYKNAKWADIIHFHYPWPFGDLLNFLINFNKPKLMTYHSDIVRQKNIEKIYSPLRLKMLNSMEVIITTSPNYAKGSMVLNQKNILNKLVTIPLAISDSTSDISISRNQQRIYLEKLNVSNGPYVLFLGVLRYYKGLHILIEAAKFINCNIVIAGNGPEYNNLLQKVNTLNLKNVKFTGIVSDIEKNILIRNCYSLVLPSILRTEAFGMVLVEAAMHSKPMISCNLSTGTSFVNLHNSTGYVVEPSNSSELAFYINKLLSNPQIATVFGMNARIRYENLFSDKNLGYSYSKIYSQLINKNK